MLNNFEQYDIPVLDMGVKLPKFIIEQKYITKHNLSKNCTDFQCLLTLCEDGLIKKVGKNNPKYNQYVERMRYELNILKELDFCSYLLITWDIVNYCTENNINLIRISYKDFKNIGKILDEKLLQGAVQCHGQEVLS